MNTAFVIKPLRKYDRFQVDNALGYNDRSLIQPTQDLLFFAKPSLKNLNFLKRVIYTFTVTNMKFKKVSLFREQSLLHPLPKTKLCLKSMLLYKVVSDISHHPPNQQLQSLSRSANEIIQTQTKTIPIP